MIYLTIEQVLFVHARLIDETGGSHGIRDIGLLDAAIARPKATFDSADLYPDVFVKAAALMESIVLGHPFIMEIREQVLLPPDCSLSRTAISCERLP